MVKFKVESGFPGERELGEWELVFNGYRVFFREDEENLELDGGNGDGCTA